MNIPNNYNIKYNNYCHNNKNNNENKNNKCQKENVQIPIKQNYAPNFKGTSGITGLIVADYVTGGAIFGRPSLHKKNNEKQEYKPRHIYASEMDLKNLDEKLQFIDIKTDGNKVTLKDNGSMSQREQIADIPEEFFDGCENDKDKEYLVKRWLVESKYDDNLEEIPYELLKAADDVGFYNIGNHRLCMDYDTKLREEGITIGKLEKADNEGENNIINIDIDGTKYKLETSLKKADIILGAANYLDAQFSNNPFAQIIKNIKDTMCGKFVKEKYYEVFVPKLNVGKPTFKNKALINHGTAHEFEYNNMPAKDKIAQEVGSHFNINNVKQIDYIDDYSSAERNHAYSYYDDSYNDQYLYLINEQKMFKKDVKGNIYQKEIDNYNDNPWEKVEK